MCRILKQVFIVATSLGIFCLFSVNNVTAESFYDRFGNSFYDRLGSNFGKESRYPWLSEMPTSSFLQLPLLSCNCAWSDYHRYWGQGCNLSEKEVWEFYYLQWYVQYSGGGYDACKQTSYDFYVTIFRITQDACGGYTNVQFITPSTAMGMPSVFVGMRSRCY